MKTTLLSFEHVKICGNCHFEFYFSSLEEGWNETPGNVEAFLTTGVERLLGYSKLRGSDAFFVVLALNSSTMS